MREPWRIEMFGGLRIRQGEQVISRFQTQKTGLLLAYLACHFDQPYPREMLVELLWPDSGPEAGRQSLSQSLSSLRRQMEPPGVLRGTVLVTDRFLVGLNPAVIATDVADFEAALESAGREADPSRQTERWIRAVDLYRGNFLEGYYDDWVLSEQRRLSDLYFKTLTLLIERLREGRDMERALHYAYKGVGLDPLREDLHRAIMSFYAALGQPLLALRQFRSLRKLLKKKLDARPDRATILLASDIERVAIGGGSGDAPVGIPAPPEVPAESVSLRASAPSPVPTGTITCLALVIEERSGSGGRESEKAAALEALAQRCNRSGGSLISASGAGRLVAFNRSREALEYAIAMRHFWNHLAHPPEWETYVLSIALYTGEVAPEDGADYGPLIEQAQRLAAACNGGHILCSEASAMLLRQRMPVGCRLVDFGVYRLEEGPERIFGIECRETETESIRPLRAQPACAGNLPFALTRFFGREKDLVSLERLIVNEGRRLISLTGPGGSGKTRLALELARRLSGHFEGAVWFVSLADVTNPASLSDVIVSAIGAPHPAPSDPLAYLAAILSRQPSMLVLDHFEPMMESIRVVARALLGQAPGLTCLAVSRQRLDTEGEREYPVPPLPVPQGEPASDLLSVCPSAQLFVDRAQAVRPDFQVTSGNAAMIARLCARLEGIPLSLELAATHIRTMSLSQMLSQLDRRFDFLVTRRRDADDRHRSLRAAIEWSYRLLSPEAQRFFTGLSVFRGGWTLEGVACDVCGDPGAVEYLAQLVAGSLVLTEENEDGIRYRMLETLREFAWDQLTPEERARLQRKHARHYLQVAQEAESRISGTEREAWLLALDREYDNLRAALEWSLRQEPGSVIGLRLAVSLVEFWKARGHRQEGLRWLSRLIARAGEETPEKAKAIESAAVLAASRREG
ncbi:MAG: AAA family ATPase [Armatimonadetes bacterium]|nr:AAA family ATPase [Armatimonadota bacterium]